MGALSNLEPKNVFTYFEEICQIPHGSGNTKAISDYFVAFAKERNLECIQDAVNNVIIIKEATKGFEQVEPIIIQGHMDMVAVKDPGCPINLEKDPLDIYVDGEYVRARGTSLGGDDGIAVAYALAILDSDSIEHPRLEVVITVDEEVGMDGAREIDLSMLKGKQLLNIDSEEEGIILTSCAGGGTMHSVIPVTREEKEGTTFELTITGLKGGHSGVEIHKQRGNSNNLMGRLFYYIGKEMEFNISTLEGGTKDNAIACETVATILVSENDAANCEKVIKHFNDIIKNELQLRDPDVTVAMKKTTNASANVVTADDSKKIASFLFALPNSVQTMSAAIEGLVETSLNLGILKLTDKDYQCNISLRSSIQTSREELENKLENLVNLFGGTCDMSGTYPAWEYKADSKLREKMISIYKEMFGKDIKVEAIHAGLECGLLSEKVEGLDAVSFGPDMKDIHTTKERLNIPSTKRVWEYLLEVLKQK